jgi:hypothetical protein
LNLEERVAWSNRVGLIQHAPGGRKTLSERLEGAEEIYVAGGK